jgi:hypothetical protein
MVHGRLTVPDLARLQRLLLVDPISKRSEFDRLKDVAQAASLTKFKDRLALLRDIDTLGPTERWLAEVPPGKVSHFAGGAQVTDVADLRKVMNEPKRLTLLVSFYSHGPDQRARRRGHDVLQADGHDSQSGP